MARTEPCSPKLESNITQGATMASLQGTLRKAGVDVGYIGRATKNRAVTNSSPVERRNTSLLRPREG